MRFVPIPGTLSCVEEHDAAPLPADPMSLRVIVLGATGLVGRTMLRILEERDLPVRELKPLASERGVPRSVAFRGALIAVEPVSAAGFAPGADLALFACSNQV